MPALPPGWCRVALEAIDSTSAELKRRIAAGMVSDEGVVITAARQTAGRGRHGRSWASPAGNLYASVSVRAPEHLSAAPELGFVAAMAVVDAFPEAALTCKWPNDVLGDGAKVCGILPELCGAWIVLGIGVNLQPVAVTATYPVGSLAQQGLALTPDDALTRVMGALARRLAQWRAEGFGPIAAAWSAAGPALGAPVTVRLPGDAGTTVTGRFMGLDGAGALMLETEGATRRILAGDVLFASAQRYVGAG